MRVVIALALACACSGGNDRAGQFYGVWDLLHATNDSSCSGMSSLTGTLAIDPGTSMDLEVLLRDWPPCSNGIGVDVDGATASGSLTCSATIAGSDGSDTVAVAIQNLSLTIDSSNEYLTLSGMQTQTDETGTPCDLTLAGSAFKPGVISN
ncbi:MAG TPA: hypothetical protein VH143_13670 [Kofleriaceae bacterium]|nr:hypothetical protein [Kofleriaceae bacterium]